MPLRISGYTDLPPGTIAAVVTYLEMHAPPPTRPITRDGWSMDPLNGDVGRYRALFRRVGEPWLWFSRLIMDDDVLRSIVEHPHVHAFAMQENGVDIGLLELDFREPQVCELSFFGVVPEAIGCGWGRILMNEAIRRAWEQPIRRLWVHTCSLDHPGALQFYIRSGFRPYKRAVEIADDPRLKGHLPLTAAAHMPPIARTPAGMRAGTRLTLSRWRARRRERENQ
jgi:GNAT superfamily N-acetyltransferase